MKPTQVTRSLALVLFAAAAAARADEGAAGRHAQFGSGLHQMQQCLLSLDLPAAQLATIETGLSAGKATLKADGEAMKTAHQQMQTDLAAGAEKSVLGSDVLIADAARAKLKADSQTIRDQVLAQLSSDEQEKFNACATAHTPHHMGPTNQTPTQ
ncbi:MAG TPA: hypothetical protein VN032_01160 [Thermoanaerobaculia bacterium]|jgi:hypothetical protein|nr:hypothetical protein [Thermoanaerobaculia bacterium]